MKNIDISDIIIKNNIKVFFELDSLLFLNIENDNYKDTTLPVYIELYQDEYKCFLRKIKELIVEQRLNLTTLNSYSDMWFETEIENLKYINKCYNLANFKDVFKNKPIVIVSAGPSLNKNVNVLKEIQGKVCILCAFSAAKVLEKEGIVPDFLTSVDSLQYGLSEYESNIPLIICHNGNKDLIKEHNAQKLIHMNLSLLLILLKDKLLDDDLIELNRCGIGNDVSYFTVMVAKFLGASTIILIGQDYSWVGENAHAEGTVHKRTEEYKQYHTGTMIKNDINGNKVYTNDVFWLYKQNMDNLNNEFLIKDNVKLIQASEGGLAIEGAEILPFKQAISKYCINSFCDIEEIKEKVFKETKIIGDIIEEGLIERRLKESYKSLKKCKTTIKDGIKLINEILNEYKKFSRSNKKIKNLFKKVKKVNKELNSNEMYLYVLEKYKHLSKTYYDIEESGDELLDNILFNVKYYNDAKDIVDNILTMMQKFIKENLEDIENNE